MLPFGSKNIKEFVENWNKAIPIDRWYRKKYNIAFNSPIHKQINLIDIFIEFWEFVITQKPKQEELKQEPYVRGEGNFMKDIVYSQKDIDDLFDKLDIDNMD